MRLHIVLSTSELIEELEYEAKERKLKNLKNNKLSSGPNGPDEKNEQQKVTNAELGKIAGVMKFTYIKVDIQTIKLVTQ